MGERVRWGGGKDSRGRREERAISRERVGWRKRGLVGGRGEGKFEGGKGGWRGRKVGGRKEGREGVREKVKRGR